MLTITEIRKMPTSIGAGQVYDQSCTRAFHIVQKVKEYLSKGVPGGVILELIAEMEEKEKEYLARQLLTGRR